jgi:hypothetical protein
VALSGYVDVFNVLHLNSNTQDLTGQAFLLRAPRRLASRCLTQLTSVRADAARIHGIGRRSRNLLVFPLLVLWVTLIEVDLPIRIFLRRITVQIAVSTMLRPNFLPSLHPSICGALSIQH